MSMDTAAARQAFAAYVRAYDPTDPKIRLKIAHTYRVAGLCRQIAASEGLSAADQELAWRMGLLHDIGRFEQVRRYGTFDDRLSVDHAALGAALLFGPDALIRRFWDDPAQDGLLQTAIAQHSAYRLPPDLDDRTRTFCQILRDADKIDILRANCETPLTDIYNVTEQALRTARVSPAVMESFAKRQATLRALRRTPVDNVAALASLAFELVYPESRRQIRAQGYLDRVLAFASDDPVTRAQFAQLRAIMNDHLENGKEHPMELKPGICGRETVTVTPENTAAALGSGTLAVFGTPALAALVEKTCWQSVAPALEPGCGTVGTKLELRHDAPTPLGGTVVCESELTGVEGRKLTFTARMYDAAGPVGQAVHERFIINDEKFQTKADARQK